MSQTTCRVCGQVYPDSQKSCPRCGCQQGAAIPAYLRCKRCGTVLPSSLRNCPQCGQGISPKTASVVLFRELANGQGGQTEGRTPSDATNSQKTTKSNAPKRAAQQDTAVGRKHRGGRIAADGRDFLSEEHLRQCHLSRMSRPLELRRFGGGPQAHARPRL